MSLNVLAFLAHVLFKASHLALCRGLAPNGAGGDHMWHSHIRGVSITPQLSSSSSVFSSLKSVPQDFGTGQCPSSAYVGFQLHRPPSPPLQESCLATYGHAFLEDSGRLQGHSAHYPELVALPAAIASLSPWVAW